MQQFKALKKVTFILGFFLVTSSFFTGSCVISNNQEKNTEIEIKAEAVPEGICITFKNIPHDSTRLNINLMDMDDYFYPDFNGGSYTASAEISGNLLEQVKQTGKVIFPFTQIGHTYEIFVSFSYFYLNNEGILVDFDRRPHSVILNITAENGIYYNNDVCLDVKKNYTGVTLSSEPAFSSPVNNGLPQYNYSINILRIISDNERERMIIGDGNTADLLHWDFEPEVSVFLKNRYYSWYYTDFLQQEGEIIAHWYDEPLSYEAIEWFNSCGGLTAYVSAFCNLIYDNISWKVEIAKSPVFVYSL